MNRTGNVGVDLRNAILEQTWPGGADLTNAKRAGATLNNVTVSGANFTNVNLNGVLSQGLLGQPDVLPPGWQVVNGVSKSS